MQKHQIHQWSLLWSRASNDKLPMSLGASSPQIEMSERSATPDLRINFIKFTRFSKEEIAGSGRRTNAIERMAVFLESRDKRGKKSNSGQIADKTRRNRREFIGNLGVHFARRSPNQRTSNRQCTVSILRWIRKDSEWLLFTWKCTEYKLGIIPGKAVLNLHPIIRFVML